MSFFAGIVLFNPDLQKLKDNIDSIIYQCEQVLLIDNGSRNIKKISSLSDAYSNVVLIKNEQNMGIAYALNQILQYADKNGYNWFLTLDQDSVCNAELIEKYSEFLSSNIGQLTCNIIDRNIDEQINLNKASVYLSECESCITSGALNNTKAIIQAGGFNEILFIDAVDIDISLRLRQLGYRIVQINYNGLKHELGIGCRKKILGKSIILTNHQPIRNYYSRRNHIYIARKYCSGFTKWKQIFMQFIYAIGIVLLEDRKIQRLKWNVKGLVEGCFMMIE